MFHDQVRFLLECKVALAYEKQNNSLYLQNKEQTI